MAHTPRKLPPNRADWTFGDLFFWHAEKFGTRPHMHPDDLIGEPWDVADLEQALRRTERTFSNWKRNKNLPSNSNALARVFFGENRVWDPAKLELQQKLDLEWEKKGRKPRAASTDGNGAAAQSLPHQGGQPEEPGRPEAKDQLQSEPEEPAEAPLIPKVLAETAKEETRGALEAVEEIQPRPVEPDEAPIFGADSKPKQEPARPPEPEPDSVSGPGAHLVGPPSLDGEGPEPTEETHTPLDPAQEIDPAVEADSAPVLREDSTAEEEPVPPPQHDPVIDPSGLEIDGPETKDETGSPLKPAEKIKPEPEVVADDASILQEESVGPSEPVTETNRRPDESPVSPPVEADEIKKEKLPSPPGEPVTEIAPGPETPATEVPTFPDDSQPTKGPRTGPQATGPTGPGQQAPARKRPVGEGGDDEKKEPRWHWRPDPRKTAAAVLLLLASMSGLWIWTHYTPSPPVTPIEIKPPPGGGDKPPPQPARELERKANSVPPPRTERAAVDPLPDPPTEKAFACVLGDGEIRDLFAAQLRQMVTGRIVVGDCTHTRNAVVVRVSGIASTPNAGANCSTPDKHVYELGLTIDKAGKDAGPIPPTIATRCGNRDLNQDRQAQRDARNEAVSQAARSARQLLNDIGDP